VAGRACTAPSAAFFAAGLLLAVGALVALTFLTGGFFDADRFVMVRTLALPAAPVKRADLGYYAFGDSVLHFWHGRVGRRRPIRPPVPITMPPAAP
jgi:hypothetical protein